MNDLPDGLGTFMEKDETCPQGLFEFHRMNTSRYVKETEYIFTIAEYPLLSSLSEFAS